MELWQEERLWECPSCGTCFGAAKPDAGGCFYYGEAWEAKDRAPWDDLRGDGAVEGVGDVEADLVSAEEGEEAPGPHSWQSLGGICAIRSPDKETGRGEVRRADRYREYMREYMKGYRRGVRKREASKTSPVFGMALWRESTLGRQIGLAECVRMAPAGLILEFGVAKGHSFKTIAENAYPAKVYGFDWWGGLPHDWNPYDTKGALKCDKPDPPPNGILIDGLFSDTLEEFLGDHPGPVAFAHVDCDLYCASAYVLHCLMDRFVAGSIIAFDEIEQWDGERQAWNKYLAKSGQQWELLGKQHAWGEVYVKCS